LKTNRAVLEVKIGSIFIADVHYLKGKRESFIDFLDRIEEKRPPQLFLLGDIFELLFSPITDSIRDNRDVIDRVNRISEKIELFYFEGNHDFRLKKLFPKVTVVPYKKQPKEFAIGNNRKVLISHGDRGIGKVYSIYRKAINNYFILKGLNAINIVSMGKVFNRLKSRGYDKKLFKEFVGFEDFIRNRIKKYKNIDYYIEGHFHQGMNFQFDNITYFNLPSFACNQSFFIVESKKDSIVFSNINLKDF